jgi:hypothetical protein
VVFVVKTLCVDIRPYWDPERQVVSLSKSCLFTAEHAEGAEP